MAYTPTNNPYIAGDPYSYDLKWIVAQLKAHSSALSNLDARISAAVMEALDQHDPIYFENAETLIHSDIKTPALAYIEGFYTAGDGGANLYLTTNDYNDIISAPFYITLDGANRWALPIILAPYVTPEMFGAHGDGITDDTTAVQIAASEAVNKLKTLVIGYKKYLFKEPITIKGFIDIEGRGVLLYDGNSFPAVTLGEAGPQDQPLFGSKCVRLFVQRKTTTWNDNSVGIQAVNVRESELHISVIGFDIGFNILGDGSDCTYNTIYINTIFNNRVGINITNLNSGSCNQNTFIGGRIGTDGQSDARLNGNYYYAIQAIPTGAATLNNNTFLNVSCEYGGNKTNAYVRMAVTYNNLIGCRYENIGNLDFTGSRYSMIIGGMGFETNPTITLPNNNSIVKGGQSVNVGLTGPEGFRLQGSGSNTDLLSAYNANNALVMSLSSSGSLNVLNAAASDPSHIGHLRFMENKSDLDDASADVPNNSGYICKSTSMAGLVIGYRITAAVECQLLISSNNLQYRTKTGGTWGSWNIIV